jgi:apolipoprotein N-acyltransferase
VPLARKPFVVLHPPMKQQRQLLLAVSSGLLLGCSYTFSLWLGEMMLVAYVPLLVLFAEDSTELGWSRRTWYAYGSLFLYHGLTNWWIASWQEQTDPYLFATGIVLMLVHPLFLMLPFVALSSIRKRLGPGWMITSFPVCLTAFEWVHGQTDLSYPWLTSGYSLVNSPMSQVADVVGVYGLSFLLACVNSMFAWILLYRSQHMRRLVMHATAALAVVALWALAGSIRSRAHEPDPSDAKQGCRVALVQPNENPWDKWTDSRMQLAVHLSLSDSSAWAQTKPDLVIWSETALPFIIRDPRHELEWTALTTWVARSQVNLLTGVADRVVYSAGQAPPSARTSRSGDVQYDVFNAAYLLNADTSKVQVHRKSMLTPFAERLPFADQLTFAMSWIEWGVGISAWGKGLARNPLFVTRGSDTIMRLGPIICIESIYPEVSRDFVANGANVLCVITNDAWYNGTPGPRQHFDIARMRAIETRRPVLRCANSGITGLIGPDGSSSIEIEPMQSGVALANVLPTEVVTPYVRFGDLIAKACTALVVFLLILARIPALQRILPFRFTSQ